MLIFTHIARVVAALGLLSSVGMIAVGMKTSTPDPKWSEILIGSAMQGGLICIALGTLAEISLTLRRKP